MNERGQSPVAVAERAATEDPVCDACVGRLVADRSFGLTNGERGRALRVTLALRDDEPFEPADPAACWVCEGHASRADTWADRVVDALSEIEFASYQIGCRVPPILEENEALLRESVGLTEDAGEPLKSELNREVGKRVGRRMDVEVDFERPDVVALLHLERESIEVSINPAFVFGRYRKRERGIPQTEWPCRDCGGSGEQLGTDGTEPCPGCDGSGYRYDQSVEQLTVPHVVAAMDGEEGVFHGAGREDVDARMLGTGRPFVIEVKRPRRRRPDLAELTDAINSATDGAVEVAELRHARYEMVERVKEHPASKRYRAFVQFSESITREALGAALETLAGTTIEQYTPQRVDHRRASRTRERAVYDIDGRLESPTEGVIEIHGEGGLYVKELIHGDEGRTEPSLAGLLEIDAEVTGLDVLAVEGEAEPFALPAYLLDADTD